MKTRAAESENWNSEKCRTEKIRMLQEELQNAQRQIDEMKARNRELEDKLLMAGAGKRDTAHAKENVAKCMVVGDSMLRDDGAEHAEHGVLSAN